MTHTHTRANAAMATERLADALNQGGGFTLTAPDRALLLWNMERAVGPETPWRLARALRITAVNAREDAATHADAGFARSLTGYAAECARIAAFLQAEADSWPR